MNKKRSLRSQRFYRWSPPLFVPTKTIKSPNFTLGKGEKAGVRISPPLISSITFRITNKKETQKNGKQKQKQSNQPAAAPTA